MWIYVRPRAHPTARANYETRSRAVIQSARFFRRRRWSAGQGCLMPTVSFLFLSYSMYCAGNGVPGVNLFWGPVVPGSDS